MSSLGVVMLVHTALDRAEQVVRHWTAAGCPVVLHVDKNVKQEVLQPFMAALETEPLVRFSQRHRCEWGTWGIVAGSQAACELMLQEFPDVRHVYLASGSCLPLRPVQELIGYLAERPKTDFIESATTADVPWITGGLSAERFTLRFPFSWKRRRRLFDKYVELQRRLKLRRRIPENLVPHMGSQWWCLTRQTLSAILTDPKRATYDAYFRRVWIPDESYYQSLARLHSRRIESRSLTLSKFDFEGRPHVFYDDHVQLLRRSDCFVARKIWPHADRLYRTFLSPPNATAQASDPPYLAEPNPGKIDRIFAKAVERRTRGRAGLYMQSRQPWIGGTAGPYSVFQGFSELFEGFEPWLERNVDARVHGHLFAPKRVEFAEQKPVFNGGLSDNAKIRDYDVESFLANFIWNTRGERQCFQFAPSDNQAILGFMAADVSAQISIISGAWALPLFRSQMSFAKRRRKAAILQQSEAAALDFLRQDWIKARVRIWSLADFIEAPIENLQSVIDVIGPTTSPHLQEVPKMVDLDGFGQFLQDLKNQGMHPYLMGDFPVDSAPARRTIPPRKPYMVK